jgi:hypothetical protein
LGKKRLKETEPAGCRRGAKPLSINYLSLPLNKGKGIKGMGFIIQTRRV